MPTPLLIVASFFAALSHFAIAAEASADSPGFTADQVAEHAGSDSCWLLIDDAVYDVTEYLFQHPGTPAVILPWCGTDASEGMQTKGYGSAHSDAAWEELENYRIGDLAE